MVNMNFISKVTGLSRYTVSRALNGSGKVHPDTVRRVLEACEKYGYVKNSYAESLVRGRNNLIGVAVPYFTDDFYGEFVERLDHTARALGRELTYRSSYNDPANEREIIQNFLGIKVCAMIVVPTVGSRGDTRIHQLARRNVPVVYFDRRPADAADCCCVMNDNRGGIEAMTGSLLAAGRTPAFLGSFYGRDNSAAAEREAGYCAAMIAAGREPQLIEVGYSAEKQDNERFGYENMMALIRRARIPDAVVCVTDSAALGVIRALNEAGIVPGEEVAVTGHDNLRYGEFLSPALTTVRQKIELFAAACMEVIETRLCGEQPARQEYRFEPEIIYRESFHR